jgi:hypothetical protein
MKRRQHFTRIVVDSNQLNAEALRRFLSASPNNIAVLTDYVWMELYKSNSIPILKQAFSVLRDFPNQTANLWGTKKIAGMDFRGAALGDMMIRSRAKNDFARTLSQIDRLDDAGPLELAEITPHVEAAREHLDGRMLADMTHVQESFPMMMRFFSEQQIRSIRRDEPLTAEMADTIGFIIRNTSGILASRHPSKPKKITAKSYFDSFITRYSVAAVIYFLEWIRRGGQKNKAINKIRNDMVDLNFAIYGTYFNGVLSADRNLNRYYTELRVALWMLGARMPLEHEFDPNQG